MCILIEIIISSFLSIILFTLALLLFRNKGSTINKYLSFIFLNTSLWNLFVVLMVLTPNHKLKIFFYYCNYISITTSAVLTLATILSFLKLDSLLTRKNLMAFFILPCVSIVSIFTNNFHHLFAKELHIAILDGFEVVFSTDNYLFYIHTVYSYTLFFVCLLLLVMNWFNVAKLYRKQMGILIFAIVIPLIINYIYVQYDFSSVLLDLTPLSFGMTSIIFFISFSHLKFGHIVPISRGYIFTNNITPIIVLDTDDNIIDINMAAEKIFNTNLKFLFNKNISVINDLMEKEIITDTSIKVYINSRVYNVINSIIYNRKGTIIGHFKSFIDITNEELSLNKLEYLGYHDYLTGLYNRTYFNNIINDIQIKDKLPLGIISGDLNNLKYVNDTLGHKAGDNVIIQAAKILEKRVGDRGLVFRMGGDEFCILIPNTNEKEIEKLLFIISENFRVYSMYSTNIALGYAIKTNPNQSFEPLFTQADAHMYINKKRIKGKIC